ncbi:MAG: hypothetical protein ACI9UU_003935, partial [Candidatus Azotimanducaceae bacterium]
FVQIGIFGEAGPSSGCWQWLQSTSKKVGLNRIC